jgi:hypothetical protein
MLLLSLRAVDRRRGEAAFDASTGWAARSCRTVELPHGYEVAIGNSSDVGVSKRHERFCFSGRAHEFDFEPIWLVDSDNRPEISRPESQFE